MVHSWIAHFSFEDILGKSEALQGALRLAQSAAKAPYPAVLVGESGTGKELFAHAIHNASARRDGPFVAINCGTLCGDLAVAEMCGYEPGSFTGADRQAHQGLFDAARSGTLFLDELQDLPPTPQSVLLRFLEGGDFVRVGGTQPVHASVRVIAASNIAVEQLEATQRVRPDLLYRLNFFVINIPPLRERREDLRPLAERCLREELHFLGEVDEQVWAALSACPYDWPGNARGLRNILLRAILASSEDRITVNDLPPELWAVRANGTLKPDSGAADQQSQAIKAVLEATNNNVSETARRLGVHRSTIYRRLGR
jgi:transcriptional regulator with PAS, ATPase and Fis domain